MDLNTYMAYRVTEQEIAQAAVRAERARIAAERPDQVVPRTGILRRALVAFGARRVPAAAVPAGQRTAAPRTAAPRPAAPRTSAPRPAAAHAAAPRGAARAACERVGSASDRTPHPA